MAARESRPCPGCWTTAAEALGQANGFEVRSCANCGTLFTAQLPVVEEASDYGAFYDEARHVPVPGFVVGRLEDTVTPFDRYRTERNRWLDIGCGVGTLLRAVTGRGWNAIGTEVAPSAVDALREA